MRNYSDWTTDLGELGIDGDLDGWDFSDEEGFLDGDDFTDDDDDELLDPYALRLSCVLRDAMRPEFAQSSPEEMVGALHGAIDSMSHAESFNFAKALGQIERGANQALSNPVVGQIARTALPVAVGAAGTLIGGPVGTAIGTSLGTAVAKSLPQAPTRARPVPAPQPAAVDPRVAGSVAATQGLVLTQQPDVLKALLALALGERGASSVNGVPVGAVMNMLSSVFNKAAEDADEFFHVTGASDGFVNDVEEDGWAEPADRGQSLYTKLIAAENLELQEAMDWS